MWTSTPIDTQATVSDPPADVSSEKLFRRAPGGSSPPETLPELTGLENMLRPEYRDSGGTVDEGTGTALAGEIRAGLNRSVISLAEVNYKLLMDERNGFVHRQLRGEPLSSLEERRLAFVRWQLDRFEEAKLAPDLQQFEVAIRSQEQLAGSIEQLLNELQKSYPSTIPEVRKKAR